ncbi:MAG: NYN domain-containing protein [Candidatus Taylorbacteria bacterium]|nr:NYN domain-containing protein [Candidatus Taylorbacteria bacterium]
MKKITSIFIDGNWLYFASRKLNKSIDYEKFFKVLVKKFGVEAKIYFYGTIDYSNKKQENFYKFLKNHGYIVRLIETRKAGNKFISNTFGSSLIVDIMTILPNLNNFVLVSGDGDFVPVINQIKKQKINTQIIALPYATSFFLIKATDRFINLETLIVEKDRKIDKKETEEEKFIFQNYIKQGSSFDTYIRLKKLLTSATRRIIIIDNYVDDQILLTIQALKKGLEIIIITDFKKTKPADFFVQVKKLKEDGYLIDVLNNISEHDRYIFIDEKCWHSGHSLKDLGKKGSMFNEITSKKALDEMKKNFYKILKKTI